MHASLQKSTMLTSGRFSKASTMQRRCEMVWGRAILAATTNKKMNAHARTMAPAKQSTAATFRNIQRPYHRTGENRRIVTKNHKTPECSNGYRQKCRCDSTRNCHSQMLRNVTKCEEILSIKKYEEILQNVKKCNKLRNVKKCNKMLRNVTILKC